MRGEKGMLQMRTLDTSLLRWVRSGVLLMASVLSSRTTMSASCEQLDIRPELAMKVTLEAGPFVTIPELDSMLEHSCSSCRLLSQPEESSLLVRLEEVLILIDTKETLTTVTRMKVDMHKTRSVSTVLSFAH